MYRLMIVAGPNRGSSFSLLEGENSVGRQADNRIVLSSSKVSKIHCSLLVSPDEVLFRDESSTNGTFINGVLSKRQVVKPGDRLGVGEFVMELVRENATSKPRNVAPTSFSLSPHSFAMPSSVPTASPFEKVIPEVVEPQDLAGKLSFHFEYKLMPFFYGLLTKNEYRSIIAVLFGLLIGISVVGSIMPMQDLAEQAIRREALIRAKVLAREVADRFLPMVASHTESQIDLSLLEGEESVKLVAITNLGLQIIAPQSRLNQLLAGGREAAYVMRASKEFQEGREKGLGGFVSDFTSIWIEPIKTSDPKQIKNQVAAMAIVAIDFSGNLIENGGLGVTYGIGFVVAGLAAIFVFFILFRLTLKPYEVLNDDLDQVLRGEIPRVTHEYKVQELNGLWDNINAAIQKLPKFGGSDSHGGDTQVNWDYEFAGVRAIAENSSFGLVAFDSHFQVVSMNSQFEEMSGIRMDAIGQSLSQMARDQAFVSLVKDLQERIGISQTRAASDEFEFSGVNYGVLAVGAGPIREWGFAITFRKKE